MTLARKLNWMIAMLTAAALMLTLLPTATADASQEQTYRITITNLTDGQPMTPYVVATHTSDTGIFRVGRPASAGLQSVAENGGVPDLAAELSANPEVGDVQVAGGAPIAPGDSVSVDVVADHENGFLSLAGMLICTNDGFSGFSRHFLRDSTQTFYVRAWDAGTEINTEAYADLVPPCDGLGQTGASNPALAENGVVKAHRGIRGVGDLTKADHGWSRAVIKVTVEPVG